MVATIIVEDGSMVDGANSYVSADDLVAYASDRGITLITAPETLIIKAMDYIESLSYIGVKDKRSQPLQWPRFGVYIDGYHIDSNYIPKELKDAEMQTAIAIDQGDDPLATRTQDVKREKVDVIEVEYMDGSTSQPIVKTLTAMLWKLLNGGGVGGNTFKVGKA